MIPRWSRLHAAALAAALALPLLAGCGDGPDVLARVGDEKITREEFLEAARGSEAQYPGPADSAKAQLLEDLVKRELLIQLARERGVIPDSSLEKMRADLEKRMLTTTLLEKMAPRDVPVSDAELAEFHRQRATESHLQVIFAADEAAIRSAKQQLDAGADFGQVADRFDVIGFVPDRGDIGFVEPGRLVNPLDGMITQAPIGQPQGPVQVPGEGWFIVKVLERRPREQAPLEQERESLRELLRQRKQREMVVKAREDLRRQYQLRVEPNAAQLLFERYNQPADSLLSGVGGMSDPPPPTPEQARQPLARYQDGGGKDVAYTLGEAVKELQDPSVDRPPMNMTPIIQQWIESRAMNQIALIEARRRHLDEEPQVERRIRERLNNALLEAVYQEQVVARATPDSAAVRAAYERDPGRFARLDEATVRWAALRDSAAAAALPRVAGGGRFMEAARQAGAEPREERVTFPTQDPMWSMLQATLMSMDTNVVRGPLKLGGAWIVLEVLSKKQQAQSWENLQPSLRQVVAAEAAQIVRDQRLRVLTDSLRAAIKTVVHADRLKALPWPVPAEGRPS